ncbi:unnamed protein product [Ilex paraguariensis]|uniref:Uncharacterized protein n=1 Tax=Ilex paraguariensis TaxID=185542 RepID=A0ABC8U7P5_9AQUA
MKHYGIDALLVDMKGKTLTIIGTVDPVSVVSKLRKYWPSTAIILVGPAKEPEKKEEPKKEEPKKEEPKKEEPPKEEPKKEEPKKEEPKKEEPKKEEEKKTEPEPVVGIMPYRPYYPPLNALPYRPYYPPTTAMPNRPYNPPMNTYYYGHESMEENPNACIIF